MAIVAGLYYMGVLATMVKLVFLDHQEYTLLGLLPALIVDWLCAAIWPVYWYFLR